MAKSKSLNVALIGQGFMGRTHSNGWGQVRKFFTPPRDPVMHTVFGQPEENPQAFADRWGWKNISTDWKALVKSDEIDLVDVVTPNFMHAPVAIAAIEAGKAVSCEKPISDTLKEARQMAELAKKNKAKTFVWYNYRRCPAVALAHMLAKEGKLGKIRHVRAYYLQDWAGPSVPLLSQKPDTSTAAPSTDVGCQVSRRRAIGVASADRKAITQTEPSLVEQGKA